MLRPAIAGIGALLCAAGCMAPPYPHGSVDELFPQGPRPQFGHYAIAGQTIRYVEVAGTGAQPIVFIHGSPGNWQAFAQYLAQRRLQSLGPLLAVDRPGFGGSIDAGVRPSLAEQARLLAPALARAGAPAIVVGHSLGGAIAVRLALDYPQRITGLVLIAASVAPDLESPRWYNVLASWRALHWLIPDELLRSNRELMTLQDELSALDWKRLQIPVTAIQGLEDELVDPRSADFLQEVLTRQGQRVVRLPDAGHFVLWEQPELVSGLIESIANARAID